MKTEINWTSRTVWTGITMVLIGLGKVFAPQYVQLEIDAPMMISAGLGFVFLKS